MSKLTKSAKNQMCTFQVPNVCNHNNETTVLCHLPDDTGTGHMSGKSSDFIAAFGCSSCHDFIDGRVNMPGRPLDNDKDWFMRRAMIRTWKYWIDNNYIKL